MTSTFLRPGWYPDPSGAYPKRWWDGIAWSQHVLDERGKRHSDTRQVVQFSAPSSSLAAPESPSNTAPHESAVSTGVLKVSAGWHPDPAGAYPQRWWDGSNWSNRVLDEKARAATGTQDVSQCPAPSVGPTPAHSERARRASRPPPLTPSPTRAARDRNSWQQGALRVETNGFAIASLVLGLVGGSLLAVIFGHVAHAQIASSGGRQSGSGMATAGLILGYLTILCLVIVLAVR